MNDYEFVSLVVAVYYGFNALLAFVVLLWVVANGGVGPDWMP